MNPVHETTPMVSPLPVPTSVAAGGAYAAKVSALLSVFAQRMLLLTAARAFTVCFVAAALLTVLLQLMGAGSIALVATLSVLFAATAWIVNRRRPQSMLQVALEVERRAPQLKNLVVTAAELQASAGSLAAVTHGRTTLEALGTAANGPSFVHGRVQQQAALALQAVAVSAILPARRAFIAALVAAAVWGAAAFLVSDRGRAIVTNTANQVNLARALGASAPLAIPAVTIEVEAPAYLNRPRQQLSDPERIEVPAGSRVTLTARSNAERLVVLLNGDSVNAPVSATRANEFRAQFSVQADGYVAIVARRDTAMAQRLIGIGVVDDRPPMVRITDPTRDLFITDSARVLSVGIEASDDVALTSLRLRYTKVSGSGEQFSFTEGEVPLAIDRSNGNAWKAKGSISLRALGMSAGDMLVYRAVAADNRPGAAPVESDALIVELLTGAGVAVEGFAVDPEEDRYAVSQQMIILKTERLLAQRPTLSAEAFRDASRELASEQRRVRAEFVFMMGGELAEEIDESNSMGELDESHEAEAESDLSAGRMVNQGRTALLSAIRAMSRATTSLTNADLQRALVHERTAVREIERAFSRTRILLRAFSQRERLDLTRRLTGNLGEVTSDRRAAVTPVPNEALDEVRSVLSVVSGAGVLSEPGKLSMSAQRMMAVDASDSTVQQTALLLQRAAGTSRSGARAAAQAQLDSAVLLVNGWLAQRMRGAPAAPSTSRGLLGTLRSGLSAQAPAAPTRSRTP